MNRFFRKKAVCAVCFVLVLVTGFVLNVKSLTLDIDATKSISENIAQIEEQVNTNVKGKYRFVDFFGYLSRLMRKNENNNFEVVKDKQGFLHYSYFASGTKDTLDLVENLNDFRKGIKDKKTKFLYVMTPDKYIKGYTMFEKGLPYNYANETADEFLKYLKLYDIDFYDFRPELEHSDIPPSERFYKTDHHWKIETAFWAFGNLAKWMEKQYGWEFERLDRAVDLSQYNRITYKDAYLGSMGRKAGISFSGVDDFTLIYPKFETDYVYNMYNNDVTMKTKGKFDQALLSLKPFRYKGSQYDAMADKYSSYLYGNHGVCHIKNKKVTGPKIVIVKDSFMVPVASFLSTVCSDIYLLDTRYYNEDVVSYVNQLEGIDMVIVSYNPQDLTEEFFDFGKKNRSS